MPTVGHLPTLCTPARADFGMKYLRTLIALGILLGLASCFVSGTPEGESKRPFSVFGVVLKLTSDGSSTPAMDVPVMSLGTSPPATILTLVDGTFPRFDTYILPAAPGFDSDPTVPPSVTEDLETTVTVTHVEGNTAPKDVGTFTAVPRGTRLQIFSLKNAGNVETTNYGAGDDIRIEWTSWQNGIEATIPNFFTGDGTTTSFSGTIPALQAAPNASTSAVLTASLTIESTAENFLEIDPDPTDTDPVPSSGAILIVDSGAAPTSDALDGVTVTIPDDAGTPATRTYQFVLTLTGTGPNTEVLIAKDGMGNLDLPQCAVNFAAAVNADSAAITDFNITADANRNCNFIILFSCMLL